MSRHRFFLTAALPLAEPGDSVVLPLSAGDLHHAVSVLRVRVAEELDVVVPDGTVWRVRITEAGPEALLAVPLEALSAPVPGKARVTLVFGVSKGSKNDDIIEGAVEVGVSEVLPVLTARSVVKFDAEKRAERGLRWRRVALAAAKQSKRASVPHVADPAPLAETVAHLAGYDVVLVAWEEHDAGGLGIRRAIEQTHAAGALHVAPGDTGAPAPRVAVIVGPEGGLAAEEMAALERAGAVAVTLGNTILRAETAAVVATALVIHELGGLGNIL